MTLQYIPANGMNPVCGGAYIIVRENYDLTVRMRQTGIQRIGLATALFVQVPGRWQRRQFSG